MGETCLKSTWKQNLRNINDNTREELFKPKKNEKKLNLSELVMSLRL